MDRQQFERLCLNRVEDLLQVGVQLANPHFHLNFPQGYHRNEDVVRRVRDQASDTLPQVGVIREPPQEGMRIERTSSRARLRPAATSLDRLRKGRRA